MSGDVFDALRSADADRQEWVRASRVFEFLVSHLHDAATREWVERSWEQAARIPLAPPTQAWKLIESVKDELYLQAPLSPDEARRADLALSDVMESLREWQRREALRREREGLRIEQLLNDNQPQEG